MATLKQRLHRKNASGTYDTIHFETSADLIVGSVPIAHGGTGATNAARARTNLGITPGNIGAAASSHKHAATDITSGTMNSARLPTIPVNKGGTGRTTLTSGYFLRGNGTGAITMSSPDEVRAAIGIGSKEVTDPPAAPMSIPSVGGTLSWAGYNWIVVHKLTGIAILACSTIPSTTKWSDNVIGEYMGSTLFNVAMEFAATLKLYACDYVLDFYGGKVFVASYDQLNGEFDYFTSNSRRQCQSTNYWTSSPGSNGVWCVNSDGSINGINSSGMCGFRPFVALRR